MRVPHRGGAQDVSLGPVPLRAGHVGHLAGGGGDQGAVVRDRAVLGDHHVFVLFYFILFGFRLWEEPSFILRGWERLLGREARGLFDKDEEGKQPVQTEDGERIRRKQKKG